MNKYFVFNFFFSIYERNCYFYLFISYKTTIIQWKKSSFFAIRRQFYNSRPDRRLLYRGQPGDCLQVTLVLDKICMQSIILRRDRPQARISFWFMLPSEAYPSILSSSTSHFILLLLNVIFLYSDCHPINKITVRFYHFNI